ncbi:hypothetical protein FA95DRAFT_1608874 [Auriscalpium vulgare]|uniref:Uncharacterized protein n=1 Tax=Auriscalpium vulgare TaxID=40419 RepID=A0ACB8RJG7_9AGAM|nr:hypothetical protein FA95DRAFT_1608874 [Auriscalpium vulgare]
MPAVTTTLAPTIIHSYAIPELVKSKGRVIIVSSVGAQLRLPTASDYAVSKFALGRLAEFIAVFAVHPGFVESEMNVESQAPFPAVDPASLPAAVFLYLTAGKADYLNSRFVSVNWDLAEIERDWKDKIVAQNGLVNKLCIPV